MELLVKTELENRHFLNLLTQTIPTDSGKVIIGDTIKIGYYTQSGINPKPGQQVIDIIKEYGEYIPLMKGKIDFGFAIVGTFFI